MKMATVEERRRWVAGCQRQMRISKVFRVWQRTTTSTAATVAKLTKFLHPFAHVVGGWFRGSLFRHWTRDRKCSVGKWRRYRKCDKNARKNSVAKKWGTKKGGERDNTLEQERTGKMGRRSHPWVAAPPPPPTWDSCWPSVHLSRPRVPAETDSSRPDNSSNPAQCRWARRADRRPPGEPHWGRWDAPAAWPCYGTPYADDRWLRDAVWPQQRGWHCTERRRERENINKGFT